MTIYVSGDGDAVGRHIERLLIEQDEAEVILFSNSISRALEKIEDFLLSVGMEKIICAGDSFIFRSDRENFSESDCAECQEIFRSITGKDITVVTATSLREIFLKLRLEKARKHD